MPRHNSNMYHNNSMGSFSGLIGKKQNNNTMNNRNRSLGGKSSFGGGSMNQVNPWLTQSNSSNPLSGLSRNLASDQQAQLALASTLLNNLLKPTSQFNKLPSTPPSLLSLNRSAPNSASLFGGSSSGFSRDRFSFGHQNVTKVQKDYRKDFKNKRFGDRKNKKPNQANKQANAEKKAEKKDVAKKEEVKIETMDVDQSTSSEKTAVVQTSSSQPTPATETQLDEPVAQSEKKKNNEETNSNTKTQDDEPKVSYSEVPAALLFCHICRKHMWDDSSFEKHLEGRPHKLMVEELDHSYKLKVNLLRHEMRVAEQQRENDIQRAQRKGRSNVKSQQRDFCAMCNLSFLGLLPAHRKNERHQRLKKFLHPKCNVCSKEFYTRLEWDDHKLTAAHLKRLAEIRKETRPDLEDTEFDIIDFIEDIDHEYDIDDIELKVVGKRDSMCELQTVKCDGVTNGGENEREETNDEKIAEEDEEYKKLPRYNPGIPFGENFVVEKTGSLCRACNKFCLTPEDAKTHCQTVAHYNNIVKILKAQNKIIRKRRLNDSRNEDGGIDEHHDSKKNRTTADENAEQLVEANGAVETMEKNQKSADENVEVAVEEDSVVKTKPSPGKEAYDPEHPDSENEKDYETEKSKNSKLCDSSATKTAPTTQNESDSMLKVVVNDVMNDGKVGSEVQEVVAEPPREVRRAKQTAVRGPRARRGRRLN